MSLRNNGYIYGVRIKDGIFLPMSKNVHIETKLNNRFIINDKLINYDSQTHYVEFDFIDKSCINSVDKVISLMKQGRKEIITIEYLDEDIGAYMIICKGEGINSYQLSPISEANCRLSFSLSEYIK